MCDFVVDALEPHGYAVETTGPGASVSRLAVGDVDLVLLDLGWPESDGLDLCMRLRRTPSTRPVPVVALTDYPAETRDVLAFGLGPDEYLSKPFVLDQLLSLVASYCPQVPSPPTRPAPPRSARDAGRHPGQVDEDLAASADRT
jgi:DNA-binding response OmpR family regulator